MTSQIKQNLTIAILSILVLSVSTVDAMAGCSGGPKKARRNNHQSYNSLRHTSATKTNQQIIQATAPVAEATQDKIAATTVSQTTVDKVSDPSPSDKPAQVSYMVVQENKPGSGLDLNDATNPATSRGTFDTRTQAEETAEMWRDVMPGWKVEVLESPG